MINNMANYYVKHMKIPYVTIHAFNLFAISLAF